ncbi:MAG: DUF4340 domain-containing protein [Gemmatimonadetes bacterium]|nr:DUF4340 domain-containing protein [Gemmatimonadota bacterium]
MSDKVLRVLLGVFGALMAAWGIVTLVSGRSDQSGAASPLLAAFLETATESSVGTVRLEGPGDTVNLQRQGGTWSANGYRADSAAVARFWRALKEARVSDLVATNPSNHRRMGVAPDSTWRVTLEVRGSTRSILVGNSGTGSGTTYVRMPEEDAVYLLESDLRLRVAYTTDDWRDRWMLAVDTSAVTRIGVELDGRRYALVRGGPRWTLAGGGDADSTTVRIILSELSHLHAAGFLEREDIIAKRPVGGVVAALGASGDTLARVTLGGGGGDRWARARGDSTLYRLAYYRVERLAPPREHLTGRKANR